MPTPEEMALIASGFRIFHIQSLINRKPNPRPSGEGERFFEKVSTRRGGSGGAAIRHYPQARSGSCGWATSCATNRSRTDELSFFNYRLPDFRGCVGIEGSLMASSGDGRA